jgi:hypothetical protein
MYSPPFFFDLCPGALLFFFFSTLVMSRKPALGFKRLLGGPQQTCPSYNRCTHLQKKERKGKATTVALVVFRAVQCCGFKKQKENATVVILLKEFFFWCLLLASVDVTVSNSSASGTTKHTQATKQKGTKERLIERKTSDLSFSLSSSLPQHQHVTRDVGGGRRCHRRRGR